jgi:Ca2+-binding EF-hand superfamily protein
MGQPRFAATTEISMKSYWLGMLLAGIVATPAFAQMGGEEPSGDLQAEWFKASDTNKDGKISYDEILALAKEKAKALEAAGEDEEKQGKVYEKYAYVVDVYNFALADGDDDRSVTAEEMKAYIKKLEDGTETKYSTKDVDLIVDYMWETDVAKYDKNGDGVVAKDELPANDQGELDAYDTNGDGKLSKDEFRDLMKKAMSEMADPAEPKEGPKEIPKEGPKEGPKETPAGDGELKKELFTLYTKEGRSWTVKSTMKMQGMDDMVSYMKTEVVKVGDDFAEIKMTMLDKDKKEMAGMSPTTTKISFRVPKASGTPKEGPKVETKEETIKVEAGEFECIVTTVEANGSKTTSWTSKKFAGLLVKTTTSGAAEMTMELVEFKE